ncbi:MAG: preprotein translocase subunit YajC [Bacteroidia bacterium]|nr:preprotein translocase subunit YajC [Bacteroidia bacterium]MCO5253402.1 preprotein translocase subunit YajC [Bacteroidota bacterium]MCZ2129858.1 preprotein translocase subunit YajC [Bacteroidia bacterium]
MLLTSILLDAATPAGGIGSFLPLILIIVVFYFFMILPQTKKNKKTRKFLEELKKGDKVVTTGGIHGKVGSIQDTKVTIECEGTTSFVIEKSGLSAELSLAAQGVPTK